MLRFTLDPSAVIAGSNGEPLGRWVDGLTQLAREQIVDLAITTGIDYDQRTAGNTRRGINVA